VDVLLRVALRIDDAEARDAVRDAIFGAGRPAGVVACETQENELIIDVNDATTPIELVLTIADLELQRFRLPRRTRLIGNLPDATAVRIAAAGLGEPELSVARLLETYLPEGEE
jgi:hypothetical protein